MNNETEVGYHLDATYHYEPSMSYSNPMTFKITSINTVLVVSVRKGDILPSIVVLGGAR